MDKNKTVIEALGFCSPIGDTPETVLKALYQGDQSGLKKRHDLRFNKEVYVGEVDAELVSLPKEFTQYESRNNRLLQHCSKKISQSIEQLKKQFGKHRIAVVLGTSTSGIAEGESAFQHFFEHDVFPPSYDYHQQELGNCSRFIASFFDVTGPCYSISTACSSGAKVFGSAQRLLDSKICDVVIVGGADSLCQLTVNGFDSLESLSDGLCNPFSRNRDGINIGESAALFVLVNRDAKANDIIVAGVGESSDAYHISAPHPEGNGAIASMTKALTAANLAPEDIDYINVHGTATPLNDSMESRAIANVFHEHLPFCSSTKSLTGHTLGAAGAVEAAFCFLLLNRKKAGPLPKQVWDRELDPCIPKLPVAKGEESIVVNHALSNSFAFGGSNCSLILSKVKGKENI
ncbi:beta-ketoacyl-[acyl-carrier-protein] synthase family protein [Parashewanella curva]|uniref:Beta-ketoacyl-[acyl-carrier-protein] synthase family protein n=1 Tax=Parashewanella curva TaxID=2338552 RepID=A0A3L8Q1D9_9GAMM|nr:beta-ketoacyl-[acyl-carrier-protein] synthase family protein [Parashewanella curva]RLV60533.1 beta-ketoacyl-[acyl-carrier-protein] synthase family protein [Parashewanella curva]